MYELLTGRYGHRNSSQHFGPCHPNEARAGAGLGQGAPAFLFHSNHLFLALSGLSTMGKEEEFGSECLEMMGEGEGFALSWGGLVLDGLNMVGEKGKGLVLNGLETVGKGEGFALSLTAGKGEADGAPSHPFLYLIWDVTAALGSGAFLELPHLTPVRWGKIHPLLGPSFRAGHTPYPWKAN